MLITDRTRRRVMSLSWWTQTKLVGVGVSEPDSKRLGESGRGVRMVSHLTQQLVGENADHKLMQIERYPPQPHNS